MNRDAVCFGPAAGKRRDAVTAFVSVWPLASWSLPVLFLVSLCLSACPLCRHLPVGICGYVLVHGPPNGLAGKFLEPTWQGKLEDMQ